MAASNQEKIKVIAVVGPTASGKTKLGVTLAKGFGGEVVSADAIQVYRGMDIASAKPTVAEQENIPHHLLNFADPASRFNLAAYVRQAEEAIEQINQRGNLPIVVGGSGLYIDTLLFSINLQEIAVDHKYQAELEKRGQNGEGQALLDLLNQKDPVVGARLFPADLPRIIRALTVYHSTGKPLSQWQEESRQGETRYDVCWIGLTSHDRQTLYDRINGRVDQMVALGLVEEARAVFAGDFERTAAAAIGHKELFPYVEGRISLDLALDNLKQQTRKLAKRQLTWFRRNKEITWLYLDDPDQWAGVDEAAASLVAAFLAGGEKGDEQTK